MICTDDDIVEIVDTIWASFFESEVFAAGPMNSQRIPELG